MKNFLTVFLLISCLGLNGQVLAPQPSPRAKVSQRVGLTKVEIDYSRPTCLLYTSPSPRDKRNYSMPSSA